MIKLPSCSLIISTYNWPQALHLCLLSCLHQKVHPLEIIIADDGSTNETTTLIKNWQQRSVVPIRHVWHEDQGFRLGAIRNKAIAAAQADYIIQIDGDLILHPNFISDHLSLARPNQFVSANRTLISQRETTRLLQKQVVELPGLFSLKRKYYALHSPLLNALTTFFKSTEKKFKYVLGANMAFWRADLLEVNGYNEDIAGWGKEDNEISVRLLNAGKQLTLVSHLCIVYHLYHNEVSRNDLHSNESILQETLQNNIKRTSNGIVKC